jgi:integrase/recombinase XerD
MMSVSSLSWSEERQQSLHEHLQGLFASDAWRVGPPHRPERQSTLDFSPLQSNTLKLELKYAVSCKFQRKEWNIEASMHHKNRQCLRHIITWLNRVAPGAQSLLEKSLEQWELSLRTFLIESGKYRVDRPHNKYVNAQQILVYHQDRENEIVRWFRQMYKIVADAYDDRPEIEKEVWDLHKMGLEMNLANTTHRLNFTLISQLWLRDLVKEYMRYNLAVHSPGDCISKMIAMNAFSHFLAQNHPHLGVAGLDRALMVEYIGYLRDRQVSESWMGNALVSLRTFLETNAYRLERHDLPKERLIFDDDLPKEKKTLPREIPEEVLIQIREHLSTLDTAMLRMVTILLECGLRISELCTLPFDCLMCDDKHEWYLKFYQMKLKQEHVIPLVNETVVAVIQAQQEDTRAQWGDRSPYLFTRPLKRARGQPLPFVRMTFANRLNRWALEKNIRDRHGRLYHLQSHQFRHSVGMRLINEDVPLEVIRRLFGHHTMRMTQVYARMRAAKVREALERAALSRKTVNAAGQVVKGDARANDPEVQLVRKGIRGQTLPIGGCGRLVVLGECNYANKCVTCPMWLTSTDDLPALKSFHERAIRLRQRAQDVGNQVVVQQQTHIITNVTVRLKSLEEPEGDGTLNLDEMLAQLRTDLAEAESGLEEARAAGLLLAAKHLERVVGELKARLAALEGTNR